MEEINESILTGYPNVITYECTKTIINQMENCICKLKIGNEQGTGFFCKIPFPNREKMLPVFITNNHLINQDLLNEKNAKVSIKIKSEKNVKELSLINKKYYTNEKYDTTIIEIKEEDEIKNFMELDEKIIEDILDNNNNNPEYLDKTIYIIQYPEGELSVSYGVLDKITHDKVFNFHHKCSTRGGSSGSPILSINNNKIIGIHKKGGNKLYNKGTFLNYPIKEFIQKYSKNINYKIEINNNISKEDEILKIQNFQAKKSICSIKWYRKKTIIDVAFTGFLCKIPLNNSEIIPVLISDFNYFSGRDFFEKKEDLEIIFNNGKESMKIKYDPNRIIGHTKDIVIIELKTEDLKSPNRPFKNLDYFLELDKEAMNPKDFKKNYINKDSYILKYVKEKYEISNGEISEIEENGRIIHYIDSGEGSGGSPILNKNTFKVFGMHQGCIRSHREQKLGWMLYHCINEFLKNNNFSKYK